MNRSHIKWLFLVVALLVATVLLGQLIAKPEPTFVPSPTIAATTSPTAQSQSTQPKITWSPTSVEVILSPGEGVSKDFTFTSDQNLQNAVLEPVPAIAGFLSVQPTSFASSPANQSQSVRLNFSIPTGATLGTFDGTIHIRIGTQTLPQTLKVVVNVWAATKNTNGLFEVKFPPSWNQNEISSPYDSRIKLGAKITAMTLTSPTGAQVHILPEGEFDYGIDVAQATSSQIVIAGRPAIRSDFLSSQQLPELTRIKFVDLHDFRIELIPKEVSDVAVLEEIVSTLRIF